MYRRTKKYSSQCDRLAAMRAAKERKRLDGQAPDYPPELPDLRMRITIERFDTGDSPAIQVMELRKTTRVDCYDAYANGEMWKQRIGLSRVLEWVRKANPRLLSHRACD